MHMKLDEGTLEKLNQRSRFQLTWEVIIGTTQSLQDNFKFSFSMSAPEKFIQLGFRFVLCDFLGWWHLLI